MTCAGPSWGIVSIRQVAALAGVSPATVSRVLNDHPNVREQTRLRVRAAIALDLIQPEVLEDRAACRILDSLHVSRLRRETARPKCRRITSVDQGYIQAQGAACLPEASFDYVANVELPADSPQIFGLVLEHPRRCAAARAGQVF